MATFADKLRELEKMALFDGKAAETTRACSIFSPRFPPQRCSSPRGAIDSERPVREERAEHEEEGSEKTEEAPVERVSSCGSQGAAGTAAALRAMEHFACPAIARSRPKRSLISELYAPRE